MNDPASPRWTDPVGLPAPTIYEPGDDAEPPFGTLGDVRVVLFLVGEVDRGWAARTAIELSDAWATGGRSVVLADFHLEQPVLQAELGGHGLEGVVDLFMYGASVGRCARPVQGRQFQFIPTGTYTPDLQALFRHPRWAKLVAGFEQARATLAVFVPAEAADLGALGTWVDQAILLGAPSEPARILPLTVAHTPIRGLIVPPAAEPAPPPPPAEPQHEVETPEDRTEVERGRAGEDDLHLPPPPTRVRDRTNRAAVLLLWVLLGVAILTAIGYVVASLRPDLMPWAAAAPAATEAPRAAPDTGAAIASPPGAPLPFSVRVVAFASFQAAHERLLALRQQRPEVLFYVTPENVQGVTYHKVMAGAMPTAEAAQGLRDLLLDGGVLDGEEVAGDWSLIQELRYGLLIGALGSRAAAEAAVDSLLVRQVPAYSLASPGPDGALQWQLYAGAFPDSASAAPLVEQLARAGLSPRLSPRFGSPASARP